MEEEHEGVFEVNFGTSLRVPNFAGCGNLSDEENRHNWWEIALCFAMTFLEE